MVTFPTIKKPTSCLCQWHLTEWLCITSGFWSTLDDYGLTGAELTMENQYTTDYHSWISQQRELLKNRQFDDLDIPNLLEAMTLQMADISSTLELHLKTLLLHLLKYRYQTQVINPILPEPYNCREWFGSIDRAKSDIWILIRKNPSLQRLTDEALSSVYPHAKRLAIKQMNRYVQKHQQLDDGSFPAECPWTYDQIIEEDWIPED